MNVQALPDAKPANADAADMAELLVRIERKWRRRRTIEAEE